MDPKYPIIDGALHHISGYKVPDDEPLMILRGKDVGALPAICEYIEMLMDEPMNEVIFSHLESSLERLKAFTAYQECNPDLQSVGCSRKAHASYTIFIVVAKRTITRAERHLDSIRKGEST